MAPGSQNPFPGLRPYEEGEHGLFFGRQAQTLELLGRLAHSRFLMVAGTSGSGKSSLVRASMLPALEAAHGKEAEPKWKVAVLRPGDTPLDNLFKALDEMSTSSGQGADGSSARSEILKSSSLGLIDIAAAELLHGENLLVVVDQFEELFRYQSVHQDFESARMFVRLLLEAAYSQAVRIYVVATMRAEFIGDCARYPGLAEALNQALYVVPRMSRSELRQAIEGPVTRGGKEISPRLVQRLLNDVGNHTDALPMLQHCLRRTWNLAARDGQSVLDLEHYERVGTLARALSMHADEICYSLAEGQPNIARRMFQVLTEVGPDNRINRHPAAVDEICSIAECTTAELTPVVDAFRQPGAGFLMPPSSVPLSAETVLDISHESFARGWDRLDKWIAEEAESAKTYKRLAETAELYASGMAGLYRNPELETARQWLEDQRPNEAWSRRYGGQFEAVMAFLDASFAAQDAELRFVRPRPRFPWLSVKSLLVANLIALLAALLVLVQSL